MSTVDDWLQGRLDAAGRQAFAQRLAAEPQLAEHLARAALFEQDLRELYAGPQALPAARPWQRRLAVVVALAASLVAALWLLQPSAAQPRTLSSGPESLTTTWQPGVELTLAAHTRIEPAADGWPLLRAGSAQLRVSPERRGIIGLRDERIQAQVSGTVFTLSRADQASLLSVQSGSVLARSRDFAGSLTADHWLWSGTSIISGSGPFPALTARLLRSDDADSAVVGLAQRVQAVDDGGLAIATGPIAGERIAGPYRLFAGRSWPLPGAQWQWQGEITLSGDDLTQAALRLRANDGSIPWRLTINHQGLQLGKDHPSYAVLAQAQWPTETGPTQTLWLRLGKDVLRVGVGEQTLISLSAEQVDGAGDRLEILGQGHAAGGEGQVQMRRMLMGPLAP